MDQTNTGNQTSNVVRMPDGDGGYLGDRHQMSARPGSHSTYARGSEVVVEWYDFGDHVPYESANLLAFDRPAQHAIIAELKFPAGLAPDTLAGRLALFFDSYFDVKRFAEARGIPFATEIDFQP